MSWHAKCVHESETDRTQPLRKLSPTLQFPMTITDKSQPPTTPLSRTACLEASPQLAIVAPTARPLSVGTDTRTPHCAKTLLLIRQLVYS